MRVRVSSPALEKRGRLVSQGRIGRRYQLLCSRRRSQVGKARVCKTPITGSSPVVAFQSPNTPTCGVFFLGSRVRCLNSLGRLRTPVVAFQSPNTPTCGVFSFTLPTFTSLLPDCLVTNFLIPDCLITNYLITIPHSHFPLVNCISQWYSIYTDRSVG